MQNIEKELRFLKIYAVILTIVCVFLFALIFKNINSNKFAEIDVERINIVEADEKLRMVISNKVRQHPGIQLQQ